MVYTVGYGQGYPDNVFDLLSNTIVGKQTVWIGLSLLVFFSTQLIDWKFWRTFAYFVYLFSLLLLVLVLIFGSTIKGATSWFSIVGLSFQPSELAKFGTALALSSYLSDFNTNLRHTRHQLMALGLMAVPILLILLQPDAGSALVFLSFLFLLFREGLPGSYFIIGFSFVALLLMGLALDPMLVLLGLTLIAIFSLSQNLKFSRAYVLGGFLLVLVVSVIFAARGHSSIVTFANLGLLLLISIWLWIKKFERQVVMTIIVLILAGDLVYLSNYIFNNFLRPHQQERINVWLRPELCDPRGSLYNVLQSQMAIGSGSFAGKGFLEGTMTKLNFVPEQSTDFIFCTIGEEQGFVGAAAIIGLFLFLIVRITILAERQRSSFSRHFAYAVAGLLFVHVFINIGMTIGLMPIIGIPLPFVSAGGSALMGFTLLVGVLLKFDEHRSEP